MSENGIAKSTQIHMDCTRSEIDDELQAHSSVTFHQTPNNLHHTSLLSRKKGIAIMTLRAKDIMTPHVKSVPQSWTMQKFAGFLSDNDISGSPVANDKGELVGIATLKDIADFHLNAHSNNYEDQLSEEEKQEARRLRMMIFEGMAKLPVEVGDIMSPIVFSVDENSSIQDIAELMMAEHLHRVFVKNGDKLTGIITTYDLLKVIVDEAPQ